MTGDDPRVERWLRLLLSTPGLTSVASLAEARRVHLDSSLGGLEAVRAFGGPIVDVGAGGGAPGIPLAAALPECEVTLLEANARKCEFLELVARDFPNVRALRGRAEEQATDEYGVAVAKALASPPVATELCLPLVRPGGAVVLYAGPSAELERVGAAAALVGGGRPERCGGVLVIAKISPTPAGFPRRPGMAKKRPLA